jgi:hypothetical protein
MTASYTPCLQCPCCGRLNIAMLVHVCRLQLACSRGTQHLRTNTILTAVGMLAAVASRLHERRPKKHWHWTRHYQTVHQFTLSGTCSPTAVQKVHSSRYLPYSRALVLTIKNPETQTSVQCAAFRSPASLSLVAMGSCPDSPCLDLEISCTERDVSRYLPDCSSWPLGIDRIQAESRRFTG